MTAVQDVLAVNYLMRIPVTEDEAERVIWALQLANYDIRKLPPAEVAPRSVGRSQKRPSDNGEVDA